MKILSTLVVYFSVKSTAMNIQYIFSGTFMVTNLVFWLFNILLMVLDVTGWPAILKCYKIQPDKNNPV